MTQSREGSTRLRLVLCLAMASGASGLAYEVIWVKLLGLWVGQTTLAVSLTVAAFLGGLVLGSLLLGPRVDRTRHPLRMFSVLELSTGVLGLAVTFLLSWLTRQHGALGALFASALPFRVAFSFVLLLPPALAMGGTLPALARHLATREESVGRNFGLLYSLNTLGAALGCALCGFFIIGWLGLLHTALLAASLNVAVALGALLLSRGAAPPIELTPEAPPAPAQAIPAQMRAPLLAAFVVTGFASLCYEVLWFRLLMGVMESTAYALTLLLFTFLLGLVLGGLWYAQRLSRHPKPLELLVGLQSGLAFAGLFSLLFLGQSQLLQRLVRFGLVSVGLGGWGYLAPLLHAGLVILVPTTLMGIAFPLVTALTAPQVERVGRHVGILYALNTLGGIAGSLLTGFVFIPLLGTQVTLASVCVLNLLVAVWIQVKDPAASRRGLVNLAAAALLLVAGVVMLPRNYLLAAVSEFRSSTLLEARESKEGTVAVSQYDRDSVCRSGLYQCDESSCPAFMHRQLRFGSMSYANTVMPGKRYMRTLAHLPMLLHANPRDVLEVCFGTGTTAGSFATYPSMRSLTLVDLNSDVFELAPYFAETNHGVLQDPRTQRFVDDGRHFLQSHPERYDVISLEPPPPIAPGTVSLYSKEFYELSRERLNPGGRMAQWIPLDQQSLQVNQMLIQAMLEAFPYVTLWVPARLEAVLIGSVEPQSIDLEDWRRRLDQAPAAKENLAEVGFANPEQLIASYFMGDSGLRSYVNKARAVSDDLPSVEYFLSYGREAFAVDDLLPHAEDSMALLSPTPPAERQRIADATRALRLLTEAYQLSDAGKFSDARAKVQEAERAGGATLYTQFLDTFEFRCLAKK